MHFVQILSMICRNYFNICIFVLSLNQEERRERNMKKTMEKPITSEIASCFLMPSVAGGVISVCTGVGITYACGWLAVAA